MARVNLPTAPEPTGDEKKDLKALQVAYAQLVEQLDHILVNLDKNNFTAAFRASLEGGGS